MGRPRQKPKRRDKGAFPRSEGVGALISIQPDRKSTRGRSNRQPRSHQMFIFRFGQRVLGCLCSSLDEHGPDLSSAPQPPRSGSHL